MSSPTLPETMKALVLHSTDEPPKVQTVPTPQPTPGSAVVRVLAANVISYIRDIYNGKRKYEYLEAETLSSQTAADDFSLCAKISLPNAAYHRILIRGSSGSSRPRCYKD